VIEYDGLYIGGRWVPPAGTDRADVISAADESVLATVPRGDESDVNAAVVAARGAFDEWSTMPAAQRGEALDALHKALTDRAEDIARTIALELGAPLRIAQRVHVGGPLSVLAGYAEFAGSYEYDQEVGNSLVTREPIGVVGAITPWNYPLHQVIAKVAAALAAGCTVVLKPAELAPLSAFALAEAADAAGLPAGVLNVVAGPGVRVGAAIAGHPDVDAVSFTGSTAAGARVAQLAAATIKKVSLELGGKSANVILPDADFERAVATGVNNAFLNSGQTCSAWTRMLVPRDRQDDALQLATAAAERLTLGHPLADGTKLGPVVSAGQRDTVRDYIRTGLEEGARLVCGGVEPPDGLPRGYYVRPTIFSDVRTDMRIAQEEIFGPVLAVLPYDDEEDAVRIANDSEYGLHGAVWSADPDRALAVARRLRTGQVDLNGAAWNPLAPFGGYKKSGVGRELGVHGFEEFLEVKAIQR
jgi:aldehyde dehydrogenase (NAD+)